MSNDEHAISERLGDMLENAVESHLASLRNGSPVLPSLLRRMNGDDGYTVTLFSDLGFDEAIAAARKHVIDDPENIDAYVIGYNGRISTSDGYVRSLFYEMGERGQAAAFRYMVGYSVGEDGETMLDDEYNGVLGEIENLLSEG